MLIFLLVILIAGLGGFGYWAYSQGYLKSIPFLKFGSENSTKTSSNAMPPVISEITVDTPGLDGFIVRWATDVPSSSQVEYGPKGSFTSKTDVVTDNTTGQVLYPSGPTHAVVVKGLTEGTDYQYRVISVTPSGGTGTSDVNYVSTATNAGL
ncbi:MAG: fibronectin type III domain-containing protein [Dehalococcoidia bacterium]|jgi:hypothetical protein